MREKLASGFGDQVLVQDPRTEVSGCKLLMAVGDMVSYTLLENGIRPDLVIYDLLTERSRSPL
jgi:uncharacterized protein (UPF0218 family)